MPRNPDNNPSERIGRLLEEMQELIDIVQNYRSVPRLPAFESEKTRRSLTYVRTVNQMRTRHKMNKAMDRPYRAAVASEKFDHEDAQRVADEMTAEPLSLDDIELMVAQTKREEANAIIERGKGFKSMDTYKPPATKDMFSKTKVSSDEESGS